MPYYRYVALGDSFAEGVGDPDESSPNGLRGWADRVAAVLATQSKDFRYANLAIRGRKLDAVIAEQLEPAVALGDSFTEGVGDPDPQRPNGVRGWADRVAEVLAARTADFGYANLAIRGRKLPQVLAEQLEPALALRPDP